MMPQSGAKYPEIDIYESLGSEPDRLYGVLHYEDEEGHARDYFDLESPGESHAVRFVWTEEELCWYLDGQQIFSTRACVPQEPMYLILNLAVGGNWPGAPTADTLFPTVFRVVVEELHVNQAAIRQRIESGI